MNFVPFQISTRFLLILLFSLLITSCGGGGGVDGSTGGATDSATEGNTLEVFYSKGPVDKADCTLYNKDGVKLAEPKKSNQGILRFQNVAKTQMVYLECTGGDFVDEATGTTVELDTTVMRTVTSIEEGENTAVVSPLTEIAFNLAKIDGDISDFDSHAEDVADEFGLDGIEISKSYPTKLDDLKNGGRDIINNDEDKYGALLTTISQVIEDNNGDVKTYIEDAFEDIAQDGDLDENALDLQIAMTNVQINPNTNAAFQQPAVFEIGEDDNDDPISENPDDDNDGVPDTVDDFPIDFTETTDTDNDGIGNNQDTDDDGDNVADIADDFPLDQSESVDTDNDGVGDNTDLDDDGDQVIDIVDAFPLDSSEAYDTDGDGIGNNAEANSLDNDGDGVANADDPFPDDPSRFTLKSPDLNVSAGDQTLTFGWKPVAGAVSYNLYLSTDSNLSPENYQSLPGVTQFTDVSSLYTVSALTNDTNYYCILEVVFNSSVKSLSTLRTGYPEVRQYAFSTPQSVTTVEPSVVVATQRVLNRRTGEPVKDLLTYPDGKPRPIDEVFEVLEDGGNIGAEAFLDSEPLGNIPTTIRTVLMLDISNSITLDDLRLELDAALNVIRKVLRDENGDPQLDANGDPIYTSNLSKGQEMAIYTFDNTITLLQDFTSNHQTLTDAIMSINSQFTNSTDLYGAIKTAFEPLENNFSIDSVTYSYVLLITDGDDTAGKNTMASAIQAKGDLDLFVIAVGNDLDMDVLTQLVLGEEFAPEDFPISTEKALAASSYLFSIDNFSLLDNKLKEVAEEALSFGDGIYLLYYGTPVRGGTHTVNISIKNNIETCSDSWIEFAGGCNVEITDSFSAAGFTDLSLELIVNAESELEAGLSYEFTAKTRWSNPNNPPNYRWDIENSGGDLITSLSSDTTTLTVNVQPFTLFTSGQITVTDLNTTDINTGNNIESTLIHSFEYLAGNGLFIEGIDLYENIVLDATVNEVILNAVVLPSPENSVYQWVIDDPTLVNLTVNGNNSATISRNGNASGNTILTLTEASSGKIETFIVDVAFGQQNISQIDSGLGKNTCAIDSGKVLCWGSDSFGINLVPATLSNVQSISVGARNACASDTSGLTCWGQEISGINTVPETLLTTQTFSVGTSNACAIDANGVTCWGSQAAINDIPDSLQNPSLISVGDVHACAATDAGVICWGSDDNLTGTVFTETSIDELSTGLKHTCIIDGNNVSCTGYNNVGQLNVPENLSLPQKLVSGYNHSCVTDSNGVTCWGENFYGQNTVPEMTGTALFVAAGQGHSCAASAIDITCWGDNSSAQTDVPQ